MGCETSAIVHRVDWSRRRSLKREREREREMDKKHVDQGRSFDGIEVNTIESRPERERERERESSSFVIVLSNE